VKTEQQVLRWAMIAEEGGKRKKSSYVDSLQQSDDLEESWGEKGKGEEEREDK